ncbi:MAG: hypothetical protein ACLFPE_14885 [Bacteroidales bacterium]
MEQQKFPRGHWMSIGLALGLALGFIAGYLIWKLTGITTTALAIGPTTGLIIGAIAGTILEKRNKHRRRPMTAVEQARSRKVLWLTVIAMLMLLVVSLMLILKNQN